MSTITANTSPSLYKCCQVSKSLSNPVVNLIAAWTDIYNFSTSIGIAAVGISSKGGSGSKRLSWSLLFILCASTAITWGVSKGTVRGSWGVVRGS